METRTQKRAGGSRIALLDNPVFMLEMRQMAGYLRRPWLCLGSWRVHAMPPPRRVATYLIWMPLTAAAPYALDAFMRLILRLLGPAAGGAPPPFPLAFSALVPYSLAFFSGTGLLQMASFAFARERDQGMLDSLVTSRLTPADLVLGKVAAIALPIGFALSLAFGVWLLFPPLGPGSTIFGIRFAQDARPLLACLWLDSLATAAAGAFAGVAVSAWCRTSRAASAAAMLVSLPIVLLLLPLMLSRVPVWMFSQQATPLSPAVHPALWAVSAAVSLAAFVVSQVRLHPVPAPVALLPGMTARARVSARAVSTGVALLLLLLLAGTGALGIRTARTFVATTSAFSPSGRAQQAMSLMQRGQYARALILIDSDLRLGPTGPAGALLWEAKGECHQELRQYAKAISSFEEVRRVSSLPAQEAVSFRGVGECLAALGKRKEALEAFRRALNAAGRQGSGDGAPLGGSMARLAKGEALRVARGLASLGYPEEARRAYASLGKAAGSLGPSARAELALAKEGLQNAPRMGIRFRDDAPTTAETVRRGSGAADAGIRPGDRILTIEGRPVDGYLSSMRILARHKPGEHVQVRIERGRQRTTLLVRLSAPR